MSLSSFEKQFITLFEQPAQFSFFCPGRINLIGEHIDYNGGQVMPCAISMGTTLLITPNQDGVLRFRSENFPETIDLPAQPGYRKTGEEWYNYPLGVIHYLQQRGANIGGLDLYFSGNLPVGAGLSSSASIEVLTAYALNELFSLGMDRVELALLAKQVENEFMGVNCGIMDQFAVAMGRESNAILLNCDTLDYEYLPFDIGNHYLVVINSNKPRKLVESKYNERFAECREALARLQKEVKADHLCELSNTEYEQHRHLIGDVTLEKRALHVVTENERVKHARSALLSGDIPALGKLMYQSHASLRELYEVSGIELDTIVDFCKGFEGCTGARMTGAGFGGCAIALVKKDYFEAFAAGLLPFYKEKTGYEPGVFQSVIADGVSRR